MDEDKNNSKKYLTNPDGSYILKKDGTPRLKPGNITRDEFSENWDKIFAKKKEVKNAKKNKDED